MGNRKRFSICNDVSAHWLKSKQLAFRRIHLPTSYRSDWGQPVMLLAPNVKRLWPLKRIRLLRKCETNGPNKYKGKNAKRKPRASGLTASWLSIKNGTLKWKFILLCRWNCGWILQAATEESEHKSQSTKNKENDIQSMPSGSCGGHATHTRAARRQKIRGVSLIRI